MQELQISMKFLLQMVCDSQRLPVKKKGIRYYFFSLFAYGVTSHFKKETANFQLDNVISIIRGLHSCIFIMT